MARHLLERNPTISYEGLDFSEVFFDVARKTIGSYMPRTKLTKADLMDQAWPRSLSQQPCAIISTWALHDLGGQEAVANVYARCYEVLSKGGILINGDFIKPDGTSWTYEPGFCDWQGFHNPKSLALFEHNLDSPTAAQNYACLIATR
jgi:hypothetical protein